MQRRYTTIRPRAYVADLYDMPVEPLNITVFEGEPESRDTGLLDAQGRRLYSVEVRRSIGFRAEVNDA